MLVVKIGSYISRYFTMLEAAKIAKYILQGIIHKSAIISIWAVKQENLSEVSDNGRLKVSSATEAS